MSTLWPRLTESVAQTRLEELEGLELVDLERASGTSHPGQVFAAVGGSRAGHAEVEALRALIVSTAQAHGYPGSGSAKKGAAQKFDRALAPQLVDLVGMTAAEAGSTGVWTFMSLVLCPDITYWRFGAGNKERWIASDLTRHMFSRLWWQAFLLTEVGPDGRDTSVLDQLQESELNQLLERTSIGGTRPLVRALALEVIDLPADGPPRREVIRDSAKRIRREMSFIDHLALSEKELRKDVRRLVEESVKSLRR